MQQLDCTALGFLYCNPRYVPDSNFMTRHNTVVTLKTRNSYSFHLLDHLAADGAGLAGGEVAVIALFQIDADFVRRFHLEALHRLLRLGDDQFVAAAIIVGHGFLHSLFS